MDVEEGLPVEVPLVYFYGHVSPADNPELYKFLVERLAALLDKRAEARTLWKHACSVCPKTGRSLLLARALRCTVQSKALGVPARLLPPSMLHMHACTLSAALSCRRHLRKCSRWACAYACMHHGITP